MKYNLNSEIENKGYNERYTNLALYLATKKIKIFGITLGHNQFSASHQWHQLLNFA
jgi:hypothetical protein